MSGMNWCAPAWVALVVWMTSWMTSPWMTSPWMTSRASAQELATEELPPPPEAAMESPIEVEPDPDLADAAGRHLDRLAGEPHPSFQDALREQHRADALHAIPLGRTATLACLEAMLLELHVREVYVPPLDGDPLTLRVVEVQARVLVDTVDALRFAYARCLATIDRAPAFADHEQPFRDRSDAIERMRARVLVGDLAAAHPSMLSLVEDAPEATWEEMSELYVAAHGEVRPDPDEERLEGWQSGAVITTSLLFGGSLLSLLVGVRIEAVEVGRYMLTAVGLMVGTFPGVMLGRTWSNPESEWTPHRLMAGAVLTLGAIGGGIALFRADLKRRHQLFGAGMAGAAIGNLVWLVGGLGIYRRQRRGLRGRPTVEISNRAGSVGWSGSF